MVDQHPVCEACILNQMSGPLQEQEAARSLSSGGNGAGKPAVLNSMDFQQRSSAPRLLPSTEANIEAIARLEEEFLARRTLLERAADAIADFSGSIKFVVLHIVWFVLWFAVNSGKLPLVRAFDPYPFVLLAMLVSCEAVLLSTFVLMKQNRMSRRADQRGHLELQINILAEREITKLLQMQRLLCDHLGLKQAAVDQEAKELSQTTTVEGLAQELERKLPRR